MTVKSRRARSCSIVAPSFTVGSAPGCAYVSVRADVRSKLSVGVRIVAVPKRSWTVSSPSRRSAARRRDGDRVPFDHEVVLLRRPAQQLVPHGAADQIDVRLVFQRLERVHAPHVPLKRPDYPASPMTARKKWILGAATVVLLVLVAGGAVFALTRPPKT